MTEQEFANSEIGREHLIRAQMFADECNAVWTEEAQATAIREGWAAFGRLWGASILKGSSPQADEEFENARLAWLWTTHMLPVPPGHSGALH